MNYPELGITIIKRSNTMKPNIILAVFSALTLIALSAGVQAQNCSGKHIKVHANPGNGKIKVTPETFSEKKGCGFEIHVPAGWTTHIISEEAAWLNGSSSGDPIYITIPDGETSRDYKYDVDIEDFGRLDPRIRVH
jgi:hypothetical protein